MKTDMADARSGRRTLSARLGAIIVAALSSLFVTGTLHAQATDYPNKPISLLVPFGPGGGTDFLARLVATRLSESNQWTVVVTNRPGAGGVVGMSEAARAAPTGYVMVMGGTDNLAIAPWLKKRLDYDPLHDLLPVGKVAESPIVLVVAGDSKVASLADLVKAAKSGAAPTFGTAGAGSISHLAIEAFNKRAGIKLRHVPYKGAGAAMSDLLGGHVDLAAVAIPSALSLMRAGKVRAIGVTSLQRASVLPDVPTFAEQGYAGFSMTVMYGLLVPKGTPTDVVARLNTEVNEVLGDQTVRKAMQAEGAEPEPVSPARYGTLIRADYDKWKAIIHAAGLQPE